MSIPAKLYKIHEDSNIEVPLFTVKNEQQLAQLPPGIIAYNLGDKIPKVVLSTGGHIVPAVPLGCRMYSADDSDTVTKYSLLNLAAKTRYSPQDSCFYIDKKNARITKLPEDKTRNFRMPMRGGTIKWSGYGVHRMPNFGDMKHLDAQINSIILDDATDLYQFSLHMTLVSMIHHIRSNN